MDVRNVSEEIMEETRTTSAARKRLTEALRKVDGLQSLDVQDFRMWNTIEKTRVVRFGVTKSEECIVREHAEEWITSCFRGARLTQPQWYALKVDFVETALASDPATGQIGEGAKHRFGTENGVDARGMRWLAKPRPQAQH